jgi:uncharacterized protein (DUF433 family)
LHGYTLTYLNKTKAQPKVLELGASPDATRIAGNVHADANHEHNKATTTFWRAAEGLSIRSAGGTTQWAVSQAVSLWRMYVRGDLVLHQNRGWTSGGWMSGRHRGRQDLSFSERRVFSNRESSPMKRERLHRITVEAGKCGGRPCIRGQRIRVTDVLELLGAGATFDEILKDYPFLEREDILATLDDAAYQTDHVVLQTS